MPQLNLTAKTKEQEIVLQHLKPMVSDALAEKINNGVKIQKDGKTLLNKKDLDGFIEYAYVEALKISKDKKSGNTLAVDGTIIMGWAIHYFEEDSIEGTLYNEDGTEYKIQPKSTAKAPAVKPVPPKPQLSMFDMLDNGDNSDIPAPQSQNENLEPTKQDLRDVSGQNVDSETGEILYEEVMHEFHDAEEANITNDEDDFDISAFDAEAVAVLSEIFGDEIELR